MKRLVRCAVLSSVSAVATIVGLLGVMVGVDAVSSRTHPVAFSDFLADLEQGSVEEVRVDGQRFRFRVRAGDGRTIDKETVGPPSHRDLAARLRPSDPKKPIPKVEIRP